MPDPLIITTALRFRQALLQSERAAATEMVRAYGGAWQAIQGHLTPLLAQVAQAEADGRPVKASWLLEQDRLRMLQRQVEGEINRFADQAERRILLEQGQAVQAARANAQGLMRLAVGGPEAAVFRSFAQLPTEAVTDLVGFLQDGSPLRALLDTLGPEASALTRKTLITGLATGQGPREIARRMRSAMGMNMVRALTISHTEVMRSYREASHRTFLANSDVLTGWVRMSAGNSRVCPACYALHGTVYPLTQRLADHPRGRCVAIPYTRDNPIALTPGPERFAQLSADEQRRMLGPGKYAAYRDGQIRLEDLVEHTHSRTWGDSVQEASLKKALERRARPPELPRTPAPKVPAQLIKADSEAAQLLAELSPEAQKAAREAGLKEVRVLSKRDYAAAVGGKGPMAATEVGEFRSDTGVLLLRKDQKNLRETFYHEVGHVHDPLKEGYFQFSEDPEWLKAAGWRKSKTDKYSLRTSVENQPVSEYAKTSPWEDFAETFAKTVGGSKFDRRVMEGESGPRLAYMRRFARSHGYVVED